MSDLLLQLLREKVEPSQVKKVSSSKGGEYHSPCPLCGGNDRFVVFPEQLGGEICQKHGITGTWSCPRHCDKGGDVISWYMEIEGLTFAAACAELKIELSGSKRKRPYRPLRRPHPDTGDVFVPVQYAPPVETWRNQATKLATNAYERLLQSPSILRYLAARGLPEAAVHAYRLGYIEAEGTRTDCIYRARAAFGLPEKYGANGKLIRALRIPRGITIPVWGGDGSCLRIRIRRRDVDRDQTNPKDPKYLLVPQPGQPYSAPLQLKPKGISPDLTTWVVVESELDAMAVHHACGGEVGVLSVLTVRVKPDQAAHAALTRAARILVALDFDVDKADGSNPGADAWPWWQRTYPQARLWPVPEGKDPGEASALGVNLADWIFAGVPLRPAVNGSATGQEQASDKLGVKDELSGIEGKSRIMSPAQKGTGNTFHCWPVPDVESFEEVVLPSKKITHAELLSTLRKHPLGDTECLVPCPRTQPSFWWRYHKNCRRCKGHPYCLMGLLQSEIFREAAYGTASISG